MKSLKNFAKPGLILLQLGLIAFLSYLLYQKLALKNNPNAITEEQVRAVSVEGMAHFYEPVENTTIVPVGPWEKGTVTYTINADTLNERFDYEAEKPAGVQRIITLGDSFTYGYGISTENNYPEGLEKLFASECKEKTEVINLGVFGYDAEAAVARYETRGAKYSPDLVLWLITSNDFTEIREPIGPKGKAAWGKYEKNQGVETFTSAIETTTAEIKEIKGEEGFFDYIRESLHKITDSYKGDLVVLALPTLEDRYKEVLREFAQERSNTEFFDGLTDYYKEGNHLEDDGHPNKQGYRDIAEDIFGFITEKGLASCK